MKIRFRNPVEEVGAALEERIVVADTSSFFPFPFHYHERYDDNFKPHTGGWKMLDPRELMENIHFQTLKRREIAFDPNMMQYRREMAEYIQELSSHENLRLLPQVSDQLRETEKFAKFLVVNMHGREYSHIEGGDQSQLGLLFTDWAHSLSMTRKANLQGAETVPRTKDLVFLLNDFSRAVSGSNGHKPTDKQRQVIAYSAFESSLRGEPLYILTKGHSYEIFLRESKEELFEVAEKNRVRRPEVDVVLIQDYVDSMETPLLAYRRGTTEVPARD